MGIVVLSKTKIVNYFSMYGELVRASVRVRQMAESFLSTCSTGAYTNKYVCSETLVSTLANRKRHD